MYPSDCDSVVIVSQDLADLPPERLEPRKRLRQMVGIAAEVDTKAVPVGMLVEEVAGVHQQDALLAGRLDMPEARKPFAWRGSQRIGT